MPKVSRLINRGLGDVDLSGVGEPEDAILVSEITSGLRILEWRKEGMKSGSRVMVECLKVCCSGLHVQKWKRDEVVR